MLRNVNRLCSHGDDIDLAFHELVQRLRRRGIDEGILQSAILRTRQPRIRRTRTFPTRWVPLPFHPAWCNEVAAALSAMNNDCYKCMLDTPFRLCVAWKNMLPSMRSRLCAQRMGLVEVQDDDENPDITVAD